MDGNFAALMKNDVLFLYTRDLEYRSYIDLLMSL